MFRSALALTLFATLAFAQRQPPGQALFEKNCSSCHSESAGAPPQAALSMLSTESIFDTLMKGRMKDVVSKMTSRERRTVAEFPGKQPLHFVVRLGRPTNARFQTAGAAALRAADVPKLKPKWSFGLLAGSSPYSQPAVAFGRIFVGADNGVVLPIPSDASPRLPRSSRLGYPGTAYAIYFVTRSTTAFAIDAHDGKLLWKSLLKKA
jgi:polyvinyl alcohol dehydrogenase (cytochrome)